MKMERSANFRPAPPMRAVVLGALGRYPRASESAVISQVVTSSLRLPEELRRSILESWWSESPGFLPLSYLARETGLRRTCDNVRDDINVCWNHT